ncbi:beta-glucosidase [Thermosporothrix hazakensis]|jgi:beta-glucosidase|uniref:Beta-glucosidase n=2 Tax=Thermosporothrix TaxID=768650 RepID=A0A326UAA6_THEHA|nr:GH1 family beta-glucosidase [Thermosporothrix hazakensis]PZW29434.1 beta-glucosidase [Thermosporothrix hazakensis]BBH85720.1 beta-glucosidase [Thermosporothrix sp. COM3]GCE45851.1 beta-glucosidase [Thermosporothrix hazakensis]
MSTTRNILLTETERSLAASFPASFHWGAATASYQIEGATREDGRGPSIWDAFSETPGKVYQGHTGEVAADHYHRMAEDVALMAKLGLDSYRFSIAWPRILPKGTGAINEKGLDFYDRLVDALLAHQIQPYVTLYHWDLPLTLHQRGGWLSRETAFAFADYAEIVARRLGDRVKHWITLNEPWCSAYLGYAVGVHAPGMQDRQAAVNAGHHLLLAHGLAVPRVRAASPDCKLGLALNLGPRYPGDDRPETARDLDRADMFANRWLLDPLYRGSYPAQLFELMELDAPPIEEGDLTIISTPIDFLGLNYYTRAVVYGQEQPPHPDACKESNPADATYTAMQWEIFPQGLRDMLVRLHQEYHIPSLYITENGAAFNDTWNGGETISDPGRVSYLRDHIAAVADAIRDGAPVDGYFVWSLMDNFEWAYGYDKRFGIVYVDYESQQRVIKESGRWYAQHIAAFHDIHRPL